MTAAETATWPADAALAASWAAEAATRAAENAADADDDRWKQQAGVDADRLFAVFELIIEHWETGA